MRTYCATQGALLSALWQHKWEGSLKTRGDICMQIADSLCCTVEMSMAL